MTAEIAIMNKDAVALASDSAVTFKNVKGQKILTSANKIFALSRYHPIGIMIYGSANFMDIPWESLIKIYRARLGLKEFDSLKGYSEDFLKFLEKANDLVPKEEKTRYVKSSINSYFRIIRNNIKKNLNEELSKKTKLKEEEVKRTVTDTIDEHLKIWKESEAIFSISQKTIAGFKDRHIDFIRKAKREQFEKLPLSSKDHKNLNEIAILLFMKFPQKLTHRRLSGIVFAGFGRKEIFPSLQSFYLEGCTESFLKYKLDPNKSAKIDFNTTATVTPFAQSEMVYAFMEGIDPNLDDGINNFLNITFNKLPRIIVDNIDGLDEKAKKDKVIELKRIFKKFIKDYEDKMRTFRKEKYISPVTQVTSMMPKKELAAMAEALINLTSFKRKVTMEEETVAGPIDVAVISKGDGFIWIKRKHYFEKELNPQFISNYFREKQNETK